MLKALKVVVLCSELLYLKLKHILVVSWKGMLLLSFAVNSEGCPSFNKYKSFTSSAFYACYFCLANLMI